MRAAIHTRARAWIETQTSNIHLNRSQINCQNNLSLRKVYGVWLEKGTEKRQLCLINTTINLQLTSGVEIVDESK